MNLPTRDTRRSLAGVIAAMALVNLVYGISFPLLALVLDSQNVSKSLIGLSTVAQAAAVLAVSPCAPWLMSRIAPAKLMQLSALLIALLFVIAGLNTNVWFWFPLRFIIGAATSVLWIASEVLINALARESWRGRIISIYTSVGAAGYALGPLLLILTGSEGLGPFLATSATMLLAGVPLFFVKHRRAMPAGKADRAVWRVFLIAPVIMLANVAYASAAESMLTFFPLYGLGLGLTEKFSLSLLTVMGAGGMLLVLPLGWVADHVNRLAMLVAIVLATMLALLLFPFVLRLPPVLIYLFMLCFGGVEGMIYALGVILVGERFKGARLTAATTAFSACWGAGTVLGPLLVGIGMDRFGNGSMILIIFVFFALYLPLPLAAWLRRGGRR